MYMRVEIISSPFIAHGRDQDAALDPEIERRGSASSA